MLALVIGVIAGVFYYMKHQSRNSTPPESRYSLLTFELETFNPGNEIYVRLNHGKMCLVHFKL